MTRNDDNHRNGPGTAVISTSRAGPVKSGRSMACVDTSHNPRIPVLMEMVGSVSRAQTPQEIYERFRSGLRRISAHTGYIALSVRGLARGEYKITHVDLKTDHAGESENPWDEWDRIAVRTEGFFGEIIRSAWPELIHNLEVGDDPVLGDMLRTYHSMMAVPIFDHGEPLNWAIILGDGPDDFDENDLESAIMRANLIGGMTKSAVISQQLLEANRRIQHEVDQIGQIQRSLLPDPLPSIDGVELAASYETSAIAGGDYYDFFPIVTKTDDGGTDTTWGILIADVSGHGPSAAVVMAMLHAILHSAGDREGSPARILRHANRHLCRKRLEGSFVTAFYGVYDPKTRALTYARAGHNPPIVKSGTLLHRLDAVGGLPLGIDESLEFETAVVQLQAGDTVVYYTDGITESMDESGSMFGVRGIERSLDECSGAPDCAINHIITSLREHESGARRDDQTIVAMQLI